LRRQELDQLRPVLPLDAPHEALRDDICSILEEVRAIEVRRPGRGAIEGLGLGLLSGAAIGAISGYIEGGDPPSGCMVFVCVPLTAGEKAVVAGTVLGLSGALTGLLIGAIIGHRDRYEF